ncbi:MAG: hydroxymethylglutaryl-CoA reductase, partial [Methanocorpusculum sp.]
MDEYLAKIRSGDLKLYALEKSMPADDAVSLRRKYIEEETGTDLSAVGTYSIPIDRVVTRNIENMIGCVQIPLGVAGPLAVKGEYASGKYWLPLATTEGALVASINRGCGAITKAGGAEVRILRDGMTRAPVFAARSVSHAAEVARWAEDNLLLLKVAAEETTNHGELIGLTTYTAGTSVFIRFEFDTKDAMGMNMATLASEAAAHLIEEETGAKLIAVSGNMCCDKKPSAINCIEGRGKTVSAGVFLSDELVASVFKTNSATLAEVNTRKNLTGSARAASLGFNAQAANVVAAMFIACG